ncbi:hypothetical protein ACIQCR_24345 [Streptomyces sp. NPDC093249]|uniref:hypothetical protein n=1 Tax=unclassified Streptomyces TaxID=2593676 RepID=UPI00380C9EC0
MYGPPQAPQGPPPRPAPSPRKPAPRGLVPLRVLFCALALLSCGFLGWAPLLRLAVVTRRTADRALFGIALLGSAALFTYMVATAEKEEVGGLEAFLGVGTMVLLAAGSLTYYLVAEIRHFDRLRTAPPHLPPLGYDSATAATVPSGGPAPLNPYTAGPPPAHAAPPPRIQQVRAELDELSDLLRRGDGRDDARRDGSGDGRV